MKKELADIDGTVIFETEKAYKFDAGLDEAVWLPKSQCEWDKDSSIMTMPVWLAEDKGLV